MGDFIPRINGCSSMVEPVTAEGAIMKKVIAVLPLLFLLATLIYAQQPTENKSAGTGVKQAPEEKRQSQERRGSISGRVLNESGEPLAHIGVHIFAVGRSVPMNQRNISTDEDGRFLTDDLPSLSYSVSPYAPGYVNAAKPNEQKYCRIGDTLTYTMTKGGIITGLVKTPLGEPVVNVAVRAVRVKDAEGRPVRSEARRYERMTDDRGVYRLYGLEAGTYVVAAGGRSFSNAGYDKYSEDVPTYHPSSTRDTANEVMLVTGQEISGIDIAYRGEKGHAVSGTVANHPGLSSDYGISINLMNAVTSVFEVSTYVALRSGNRSFGFYGIADGEYFIKAQYAPFNNEKDSMASAPKRITVKAGDVTGIELTLAPLASISGRLVFEPLTGQEAKQKCETKKEASLEEALILIRRDSKGDTQPPVILNPLIQFSGDEKGEFSLYRFEAGLYHLSAILPSESWYIKAIGKANRAKANQPLGGNAQLSDIANKGLSIKPGERVNDLTITLGEGAASLSGKLVGGAESHTWPQNLRLYLVPMERAADALRFAQTNVQSDGTFSLTNIAPGKYWTLTRMIEDEELTRATPRQLIWDAEGRNTLRKEAEAANQVIELQTCQRIVDYLWRGSPQPGVVKPMTKKTQ